MKSTYHITALVGLLVVALIAVPLVATTTNTVSSQTTNDWCLNASSSPLGVTVDCSGSSQSYQSVNISAYQTASRTEGGDTVIGFTTRIEPEIRESAKARLTLETPSGDKEKIVQLVDGEVTSAQLNDVRAGSGPLSDNYTITVDIFSSVTDPIASQSPVATDSIEFSDFYIDTRSLGILPNGSISDTGSSGDITVQPTDTEIQRETIITTVNRYNDGTNDPAELKDDSIPPRQVSGTNPSQTGFGELQDFGNISEQNIEGDASIQSVSLEGGGQALSFGTVAYGVPETEEHTLVVTYEMQTEIATDKGVGVEIVDASGNVIDESQQLEQLGADSDRWLQDTVIPSERDNVFSGGLNEDVLQTRQTRIPLTELEKEYVNENYEAYMVFRTSSNANGGITIFKPNQVRIESSDKSQFNFRPTNEFPVAGEDTVEFELQSMDPATIYDDPENPTDAGSVEWTINTPSGDTIETTEDLSISDVQRINSATDTYLATPSVSVEEAGSMTVEAVAVSPDGSRSSTRTTELEVYEEAVSGTPGELNIVYRVDNEINPLFGTHDVEPSVRGDRVVDTMDLTVIVSNGGNSRIERTLEIKDTLERENGYENQTRGSLDIAVGPGQTKTYNFQEEFYPEEYGNHQITVVDTEGEQSNVLVQGTEDQRISDVYVLQPATLTLENVRQPEKWLIEDPYTATLEVANKGDLSTDHPASDDIELTGTIPNSEWEDVRTFPDDELRVPGGEARQNALGQTVQVRYERGDIQFSPNFPEVTTDQRNNLSDGPFATGEVGTRDLQFEVDHNWASNNFALKERLDTNISDPIEFYDITIIDTEVPAAMDSRYGTSYEVENTALSPYGYTQSPYTNAGGSGLTGKPASNFANTGDIMADNYNEATMETTQNVTRITQPSKTSGEVVEFDVKVRNNGATDTGFIRLVARADQQVFYPEDFKSNSTQYSQIADQRNTLPDIVQQNNNIVGLAGRDIAPFETQTITVPVVIPNHPDNNEPINIEIQPRTTISEQDLENGTRDYASYYESVREDRFSWTINPTTYGDTMYIGYVDDTQNPQQLDSLTAFVDETCQGYGLGSCNPELANDPDINFIYRNVGSQAMSFEPRIDTSHKGVLHNDNSTSAFGQSIADHHLEEIETAQQTANSNADYEGSYSKTIQPNNYATWNLNTVYETPGKYLADPIELRETQNVQDTWNLGIDSNAFESERTGYEYDSSQTTFQVYDITDPSARWNTQDCTSGSSYANLDSTQCLENEYNGLSSIRDSDQTQINEVWEGGAILLDGQQRADIDPQSAQSNEVSSDNVGVNSYNWTLNDNRGGETSYNGRLVHRFNDAGSYNIGLTVTDHNIYTQGEANTDTQEHTIDVIADNSAPTARLDELECGASDTDLNSYSAEDECWTSGGTTHVWSEGDHTDGADIDWGTFASDGEVGIESVDWETSYGSETFSQSGNFDSVGPIKSGTDYTTDQYSFPESGSTYQDVTTSFTVTDFAGNTDTDTNTFTVVTDNSDGTFNCTAGSSGSGDDCYAEDSDVDGEPGGSAESNHPDGWSNESSAEACVEFNAQGPNGTGIGFDTSTLSVSGEGDIITENETTIEVCVDPSVSPSASASANANAAEASCSTPSSCGSCDSDSTDSDEDYDQEYTYESESHSSTISVDDYHGNNVSATIGADVEADAYDTDYDYESGDSCEKCSSDCPEPDPPAGGGEVVSISGKDL